MSYSITVHALDGQLRIEHSGQVPDGTHVISGHEDEHGRSVSVVRQDAEGRHAVQANAHHSREH